MAVKWKDYFIFTKKERTGIFVLFVLLIILYVTPSFFPEKKIFSLENSDDSLRALVRSHEYSSDSPVEKNYSNYSNKIPVKRSSGSVFPFDPNTLNAEGWQQLGIRERTISTILKYRTKGGVFRHPDDLKKIFGLSRSDVTRLLPFVRIKQQEVPIEEKKKAWFKKETKVDRPVPEIELLEINNADSATWEKLPLIGPRLAIRIVHFREKLGGFYSTSQVAETFGLHDSVFRSIQSHLVCSERNLRHININTVDANTLAAHPYVSWQVANALVQYRTRHGLYNNVAAIRQVQLITNDLYAKLEPYLITE
ncbi:MAG TPA: helix-hairpin-helix domain-containing protein [Flavitalea sp.]|nr:helix-hairpin-helix domain-containing protein [Flavitalea sp.]